MTPNAEIFISNGIKYVLGSFITAFTFTVGKQGDETTTNQLGDGDNTTTTRTSFGLLSLPYRTDFTDYPGSGGTGDRKSETEVPKSGGLPVRGPAGSPTPNPNRNEGDERYERASRVWRTMRVPRVRSLMKKGREGKPPSVSSSSSSS